MSQCIRVTATLFFCGMCCLGAQASFITYVTTAGSMTGGGDVDASVTFTTGTGTIMVTLNNLEPNPADEAELLSDLFFTVGNGTT